MEYTDARCPRCDTWQTVLVGYDGTQICLSCGQPIGRGTEPAVLAPLGGAGLLAESWMGAGEVGPEQRRARLRAWLKANDIGLSDDLVEVLAHCESASEVRFALPIVTLSAWRVVGERTVSDGRWMLRVQPAIGSRRVGFVLESGGLHQGVVIEIDEPHRNAPEPRGGDQLRTLELQAQGYTVLRVPAAEAKERGLTFRKAFYRQAMEAREERVAAPSEPDRQLAKPTRIWPRHELVYDAHDRPLGERRELVEDWLRSREVILEPWQYDFLAHCHRAAEVHFAIPFLRLPDAEPIDARTVHLDPWHTLQAQLEVDDYAVDFHFMTSLAGASEVASVLVEIHPARGPRDRAAETERLRGWSERGLHVVELSATEARKRGEQWAASLLREVDLRRGRAAG